MAKFNKRAVNKDATVNLAGGKAFKRNPKEELAFTVVTSFLEDKFYESGSDRVKRISTLVASIKDIDYLCKLAYVTRQVFNMRSTTHVLLAEIAKHFKGDGKVADAVVKCTVRPDDLTELVAYLGKPIPNQIKKGIARALNTFKPYSLAKYKMEGKGVSLVDLFNLVHPKPLDDAQGQVWGQLIEGKLQAPNTWEVRLSSGEDKGKVWRDLIAEDKIGYMALLRNLRNIDKQADIHAKGLACQMIADKDRVLKSRQLPFRFFKAYEQVENQDMLEAISQALNHSMANVPKFDGKTLVAVDASGSMDGQPIKIASIFAAALFYSNSCDLILYDTKICKFKALRSTPVMELAHKIQRQAMGGGTETSLVFQHCMNEKKVYDRIVILSDQESWRESYWSRVGSPQQAYDHMCVAMACRPYVYAIDIQGYGTTDLDHRKKVMHVSGWSDKMFDVMKYMEQGDMVEWIMNYEKDNN